jgi:hypothetical protein
MKIIYSVIMSLLLLIMAMGEAGSAVREINNDRFPQVGFLNYGEISCASFILKHGVIATAKHCFTHHDIDELNFDPNKVKIRFAKKGGNIDMDPLTLQGEDVLKLIMDRGSNDIAYIIYKREKTEEIMDLSSFEINSSSDVEDGLEIFRAGFPMGFNHVFDKVITSGCSFSGKTDFFQPTITDPGYEGMLFDTDCPAWYGDSGGPVFSTRVDDGNEITIIHGVLSHTFDVDFAGNIREDAKGSDLIGEFVKTSMFTPFNLASDLDIAMEEEETLYLERQPKVVEEPAPEIERPSTPEVDESTIEDEVESTESLMDKLISLLEKLIELLKKLLS